MTYRQRLSVLIFTDSMVLASSLFIGSYLLYANISTYRIALVMSVIVLLIVHYGLSYIYRLYKKAWEYASIGELVIIVKMMSLSIVSVAIIQQVLFQLIHYRLLLISWMLNLLMIGGSRLAWRIIRDYYKKQRVYTKRALIVGAGAAGTMIVRQLFANNEAELLPVAFIDDNVQKRGLHIMGIPVVGGVDCIEEVAEVMNIDHIVIAIPSLNRKELNRIYHECAKTKAKTQIMPMLEHLATGKVSVNEFRDVQVDDLLGRDPVELDIDGISESMAGKIVLVTGAGGSIGSEICRQIAKFQPAKLILLGHGENSVYTIEMQLKEMYKNNSIQFIPEIGDLQDAHRMIEVMRTHSPDIVYHAAAHKHVPLMEANPAEAVKNNVIGTWNIAKAASMLEVQTFVMISTDKAVNPTSVMGATKRLAEMIVQHMNTTSKTRFVAVRFGNVLGSNGSVIPLFKRQIEKGGPVTVTHPDMIRYFMTIPEAARLVIQAGVLAKGGEIFVLDMGEPVKILDLAKNMIRLSGYTTEEIGIEYTGIRPGEKLYEELLQEEEIHDQQIYPKIYIGKSRNIHIKDIEDFLKKFMNLSNDEIRERLLSLANHRKVMAKLSSVTG